MEEILVVVSDVLDITSIKIEDVEVIEIAIYNRDGADSNLGYEWVQNTAQTEWIINHNLGFRPSVEVFSDGGVEVDAMITHISINLLVIQFIKPMSGRARLN